MDHGPKVQSVKPRPKRYVSHALVEVRKIRWLPLFCHSAVLLDLNTTGFKLEFTGEVRTFPGKQYWLHIPLAPLGIPDPQSVTCLCEVRWFDERRFRIGGVFVSLQPDELALVERAVASLKVRGQL